MIRKYRFAILGMTATALLSAADGSSQAARQAAPLLAQLPLRFEANQGQFDSSVRYAARTSSYTLALTAHGASMVFTGSPGVTLDLHGGAAAPAIEPLEVQAVTTDYLVGNRSQWHTGVSSYSRVRYHSVYPGVDMVFYGRQDRLEYDFVLQPGANPNAIRLQFQGASAITITPDGDLALDTPAGRMLQKKPVIYQAMGTQRREVTGKYVLLPNRLVGVELGSYDRTQTLVIDPVLTYSTLVGGSGTDTISAIRFRDNKVFIAGTTATGSLVSTDLAFIGNVDCFLEIIDVSTAVPTLKYFTYLGGAGIDKVEDMVVDAAGFVYLGGTTGSADFPMAAATQSTGASYTFDAFVAKIDPNQAGTGTSLVFSSYLGGVLSDDEANGIAADNNGIVYILGTTKSADFPITDNAYNASLYGISDCFMAQIDTNRSVLMYSSYFGSETADNGRGLALGNNGLAYFIATTAGVQFPTAGAAYNGFASGAYDVIVGAFDLTKTGVDSLVYSTYFGGSGTEEVRGIDLDGENRVLITGYTLSSDFPVTDRAAQNTYKGNGDAFVSMFDFSKPGASGLVYSTFLGGGDGDVGYGVTADSRGFLYVTGYTLSEFFPTVGDVPQLVWGGGIDMFITRINPAVAGLAGIDYSTSIGVESTIVGCCLALGVDGSLYVAGFTEAYLPLINDQGIQYKYGGGFSDGFLMVLSPAGGVTTSRTTAATPARGVTNGVITRKPARR